MKALFQKVSILILKLISHFPLWFLYIFSDISFFIIFYIVMYRKRIVINNLQNAFPEKSETEIYSIAKKYYHHFCDLGVETIKLNNISFKRMNKYVRFSNTKIVDKYFDEGKGLIYLSSHYNNWEWGTFGAKISKHQAIMIYNPMRSNPPMDKYMKTIRSKFGGMLATMEQAPRIGLTLNDGENPKALWLASDQTAPRKSQYWTNFLNQDTCFFSGAQKIASKTNNPVIFHYSHKVKRGQYIMHLFEIAPEPKKLGEYDVLLDYINILEEVIKDKPEFWLWSHRRWKHKKSVEQDLIPRKHNPELISQIRETINSLNKIKDLKEL